MNTPAPLNLPTVAHVEALPGHAARLTLEDGQAVTADPGRIPRACLFPVPSAGGVLLEDWKDQARPAYHVPARLCGAVSAALDLRRVGA